MAIVKAASKDSIGAMYCSSGCDLLSGSFLKYNYWS